MPTRTLSRKRKNTGGDISTSSKRLQLQPKRTKEDVQGVYFVWPSSSKAQSQSPSTKRLLPEAPKTRKSTRPKQQPDRLGQPPVRQAVGAQKRKKQKEKQETKGDSGEGPSESHPKYPEGDEPTGEPSQSGNGDGGDHPPGGGGGGDGGGGPPGGGTPDRDNRAADPAFSWPEARDCWSIMLRKGWSNEGQWRRYWPNDGHGLINPGSILRVPVFQSCHNQRHYSPRPHCYDADRFPSPLGYVLAKLRFVVVIAVHKQSYISLPMFTYSGLGVQGFREVLQNEHIAIRDHRLRISVQNTRQSSNERWPSFMGRQTNPRNPNYKHLVTQYIWSGHTRYIHPRAYVKITAPVARGLYDPAEYIGFLEQNSTNRLYAAWRDLFPDGYPRIVPQELPVPDNYPRHWDPPPSNFGPDNTLGIYRDETRMTTKGLPHNPYTITPDVLCRCHCHQPPAPEEQTPREQQPQQDQGDEMDIDPQQPQQQHQRQPSASSVQPRPVTRSNPTGQRYSFSSLPPRNLDSPWRR
ncbi:hypothetical protein UCRPC4_g05759 [Phaeomoniella chlamydospora]|uniref:Uncharacterized protein n=1 Tax=Phaeomoniella chlamydospora TaxID=158046 RepID=A0A0G2E163_PHACM|nr:hypothetical protein UCRPC4_g05759 [Phaeomoniella chlamydospora]